MERDDGQPRPIPTYVPAATEEILTGARLLRRAFLEIPPTVAHRDTVIVAADATDPPALLINHGLAYSASYALDGRRTIAEILLTGDIAGLDHAVLDRSNREIVAANLVSYIALGAARVRQLMHDPQIALRAMSVAGEARWRSERHLMAITRFDARARVAGMLLDIYERLRRRDLISRPTFNLPLTQDQIGDHLGITMVHVSRTLRRMREERLVLMDRQVVIVLDLDELRRAAAGLPPPAQRAPRTTSVGVQNLSIMR